MIDKEEIRTVWISRLNSGYCWWRWLKQRN